MHEEPSALTQFGVVLDEQIAEAQGERTRTALAPGEIPLEILLAAIDEQVELEANAMRVYLEAVADKRRAWLVTVATARVHGQADDHLLKQVAESEQSHSRREQQKAATRLEEVRDSKSENEPAPHERIERIARLRKLRTALLDPKLED